MSELTTLPPVVVGSQLLPGQNVVRETVRPASIEVVVPASKGDRGEPGPKGDSGIDNTALINHIIDDEPHPAYDDMLDLTLLFENGLI